MATMKRILSAFIVLFVLATASLAATEALQIDALWSGLNNPTNGKSYSGAIVATFAADGSTAKAVWEDKEKTLPSALGKAQFTLDSNGQAEVFGDGVYVIKVYAPTDTGLSSPLMTFDGLTYINPGSGISTTLANYSGDLEAAVADIGSEETTLYINTDPDDLTGNLTIPSTLSLVWLNGHELGGAFTLTINGELASEPYQLFEANLTVAGLKKTEPEWWYTGTGSYHTAIQSALDAMPSTGGECVLQPSKTYTNTAGVIVNIPETYFHGAGVSSQIVTTQATGTAVTLGTDATTGRKIRLENMTVDCGGLGSDAVFVRGGNNVGTQLRGLRLTGFSSGIVWSETGSGGFDGIIDSCQIDPFEGDTGIKIVNNSSSVTITNCWIRGFNGFTDVSSIGVLLQGGSASVRMHQNNIEGLYRNISITNTNGNTFAAVITQNYFETYGAGGLDVVIGDGVKSAFIAYNYMADASAGVAPNASANSIRIDDGAINPVIMANHFLNHTGNSVLNNNTSATAGIKLIANVNQDTGATVSSVTGVQLNISTDGGIDNIFNQPGRGFVIGASSGSGDYMVSVQEATSRNAGFSLSDTDGVGSAFMGMARAGDEIVTGSGNRDVVLNSKFNKIVLAASDVIALKLDASVVAGDTRMLIYDVDNGTVERVTVGAADSGGAGFKVLRIPN